MSLYDCEKCWNNPCTCGHDYQGWNEDALKQQIVMLQRVLAQKGPPATDPLVWWLSPAELALLDAWGTISRNWTEEGPLPAWLNQQLLSAVGRNGRGRLWADDRFQGFGCDWVESPLARHCEGCCGIVIGREDLPLLERLPGLVTDRTLKRV